MKETVEEALARGVKIQHIPPGVSGIRPGAKIVERTTMGNEVIKFDFARARKNGLRTMGK